jgi:cell division protein FtsB
MMMLILIVLLVALMIPLTAVILDSQVGRALAARLERGNSELDDGLAARLGELESEVERLVRDVERLDEESAFLQRLIEKKPDRGDSLPPGDDAA